MNKKEILKNVKAVIFDLDGVLVDTAVYHFKAWKKLANQLGFDFTEQENEQLKGVSRVQSLEKILHWANVQMEEDKKQEYLLLKNSWYLDFVRQLDREALLPGTWDFLSYLKNNQYKIALGSASKNAELVLAQTCITDFFDVIIDGNTVTASKPAPEVFLSGAKRLGIAPQDCLVFEDAQVGVEAARAAGMSVIGVAQSAELTDCDAIVADLSEMNF